MHRPMHIHSQPCLPPGPVPIGSGQGSLDCQLCPNPTYPTQRPKMPTCQGEGGERRNSHRKAAGLEGGSKALGRGAHRQVAEGPSLAGPSVKSEGKVPSSAVQGPAVHILTHSHTHTSTHTIIHTHIMTSTHAHIPIAFDTDKDIHILPYMCTHKCTQMTTAHTYTNIHTHQYVVTHSRIHPCKKINITVCAHALKLTPICSQTCMHRLTHISTYSHMPTFSLPCNPTPVYKSIQSSSPLPSCQAAGPPLPMSVPLSCSIPSLPPSNPTRPCCPTTHESGEQGVAKTGWVRIQHHSEKHWSESFSGDA